MPNDPRDAARGRAKLPGLTSPIPPTTSRIAPSHSVNLRIAPAHVSQRQSIKPGPVPTQAKRGVAGSLAVNPHINRHALSTVQPKVAQPRAMQQGAVRTAGMNPQSLALQRHPKPATGPVRPGVASPFLSKCGCVGSRPSSCNCHGSSLTKTLQLSKGKNKAKPKTPGWLKTWRNLQCYALDTARAMAKRMTVLEIEEYLKTFLKDHHSHGVRGHCSEGTTSDPEPSGHTKGDLEIFHSYHRDHKPW